METQVDIIIRLVIDHNLSIKDAVSKISALYPQDVKEAYAKGLKEGFLNRMV